METIHPVLACAVALEESLREVAGLEVGFMAVPDQAEALLALSRVSSQVDGLRLRLVAAADEVAAASGHRDVAAWLGHRTRVDRPVARAQMRLARALDRRWQATAAALGDGAINTAQAEAIVRALDALPDKLDPSIAAKAEAQLVEYAAEFGPQQLRILGRRILDVVAPEVGEEHERRRLQDEENHARKTTSLTTRTNGDGTTSIRIRVPDAAADRLLTYLHAYTNPRRPAGTAAARTGAAAAEVGYDVRLGHAFCALLEHLDPTRLPIHGGTATTVTVTIDLETLLSGIGVATTGTGGVISAGEARRLACTAGLVPVVLGTRSEILDLGRAARLYTPAQRRALALRDQTCRAEGCDIPADWCEAHHLIPWSRHGNTDLTDGVLLCSHHHHRAHDDRYLHDRLPTGDLRFHRRR